MTPESSKKNPVKVYNLIGSILIGAVCILYTIFHRYFAQIHIDLPHLNFPVFVGEQVFFLCSILLILRWKVKPPEHITVYLILGVYLVWLLIKALQGYVTNGPYALRNAALFYYPLFAVFGFYFYEKRLLKNQPLIYFLLVLLLILFKTVKIFSFHRFPDMLFYIILAMQIKDFRAKMIFMALFFIAFDFPDLFLGSRSHYLGLFASAAFLWMAFAVVLLKSKNKYAFGFVCVSIIAFILGIFYMSDKNKLSSLYNLNNTIKVYHQLESKVAAMGKDFVFEKLDSKLYSHDVFGVSQEELHQTVQDSMSSLEDHIREVKAREAVLAEQENKNLNQVTATPQPVTGTATSLTVQPLVNQYKDAASHSNVHKETSVETPIQAKPDHALTQEAVAKSGIIYNKSIIEKNFSKAQDQMNEIIRTHALAVKTKAVKVSQAVPQASQEIDVAIQNAMKALVADLTAYALEQNPGLAQQKDFKQKIAEDKDLQYILTNLQASMGKMAAVSVERDIGSTVESTVDVDYGNMVFRLFIWEDMINDMIKEKAFLWGINLGKPQRSKRIEVLGWAKEEWERDGWITPHNSYLHMIYRAGIVGVTMIIAMFVVYGWMVRVVIQTGSVTGVLLTGVLVYMLVIATFLVMYEFPYSAIPFWSLYGMTLAFCVERRKEWLARKVTAGKA